MGDGQPKAFRQITGDDVIAEILRNAEQGVFKIRYTALLPSIYHVYLHPSDYDAIKPALSALAAEARAALAERIAELNRASRPSAIARTLGFDAGKGLEYKILDPEWTLEFHADAEEKLGRGDIEIYSELASAQRPDFGEGAVTRHVTKRLATGERTSSSAAASAPSNEATALARPRGDGSIYGYLRYEDSEGSHEVPIDKNQVVIGRGGKSFWVDVKIPAPSDISREHCRIRRDPATGQFYLTDVSQFGTTVDGKRAPAGQVEVLLPARAVLGLADSVFLNFEAAKEGIGR